MDLSRKMILASCVCAAFLSVGTSCMVEDRNIEDEGVFVCQSNRDCLEGSLCDCNKDQAVKKACVDGTDDTCAWDAYKDRDADCDFAADGTTRLEGTCAREDDINKCQDKDGDGFMKPVSSNFSHECGFNDKNPQDHDDTDKMSYPGADEVCDGKDNDNDGCVDGTCTLKDADGNDMSCDAENQDYCQRIAYACIGSLKIYDSKIDDTVCSAKKIGANVCLNGNLVFAKTTDNKNFEEVPGESCPTTVAGYVESEFKETGSGNLCDKKDNDCNGRTDEGCKTCVEPTEPTYCVVIATMSNGQGYNFPTKQSERGENSTYDKALEKCNQEDDGNCLCLGTMKCHENTAEPVCVNANNQVISTPNAINTLKDDSKAWNCAKWTDDIFDAN